MTQHKHEHEHEHEHKSKSKGSKAPVPGDRVRVNEPNIQGGGTYHNRVGVVVAPLLPHERADVSLVMLEGDSGPILLATSYLEHEPEPKAEK